MSRAKLPFDYRQTAGFYVSSLAKTSGDITINEDVVIDGPFEGSVHTSGLCEIAENGIFDGEIHARAVTILGSFEGRCHAQDNIDVKKSSKIKGYLTAPLIGIESGTEIDAHVKQPIRQRLA